MAYHPPLDYEALSKRVLELLAAGMSLKKVARELGIGKSSVPRLRDWGRGCLAPRNRHRRRLNITVLSDMTECREIRNRQHRSSRKFIEDLRREHPERERL